MSKILSIVGPHRERLLKYKKFPVFELDNSNIVLRLVIRQDRQIYLKRILLKISPVIICDP